MFSVSRGRLGNCTCKVSSATKASFAFLHCQKLRNQSLPAGAPWTGGPDLEHHSGCCSNGSQATSSEGANKHLNIQNLQIRLQPASCGPRILVNSMHVCFAISSYTTLSLLPITEIITGGTFT